MPEKKYNFIYLILPVFFSFLMISCNKNDKKYISEGIIVFDAKVINTDYELAGLAPSEMTTYFKNDHFYSEMSTMGIFVSKFITNPHNKTFISMVKIFDVKNACIENENDIKAELESFQLDFNETNETKVIAGYNCKKLIAIKKNNPKEKFDVYFTDEFNIEKPNFSTPYEQVKGVVMQFRLKKFNLEMEFTANEVKQEKVDDKLFDIPPDYKVISKKEMNDFFKSIE